FNPSEVSSTGLRYSLTYILRSVRYMRSLTRTLAILFASLFIRSNLLFAQLTTGVMEGTIRGYNNRPVIIQGAPGFREEAQTSSDGIFSLVLPYGKYQLSLANSSSVTIFIVPLETTHIHLLLDSSGALHASYENTTAGIWSDRTHA